MTLALERQVLADKVARDTAKLAVDSGLAQVKLDLAARGVGGRVADEVVERAKLVFDEAVYVVEDNPGIVGGTIAAIVLWFVRNPIIDWFDSALESRR